MQIEISPGPHIRSPFGVKNIMWGFAFSLLFPSVAGCYFFGWSGFYLIIATTLSAVISEALFQYFAKQKIAIFDGSAVITGLLLALILPPTIPLWMAGIGAAIAIILVKGVFGGLGYNIFNPALGARAILLASWPVAMTLWVKPFDAITTATPLYLSKIGQTVPGYWDLFIGNRAGSLGETSALAILLAALFLLLTRIIDWPAPTAYIGTVVLLCFLLGKDPVFNVLSGGLLFGAIFMATDYVTTPVSTLGRFLFGLGCGIMTVLIRFYGGFPEGVNYSILLMNILTPIIDSSIRPRVYGRKQ